MPNVGEKMKKTGYYRGDIFYANLARLNMENHMVLIVSSFKRNTKSDTVSIVIISSQFKKYDKTHVEIEGCGLEKKSNILVENIYTVWKSELLCKIGQLDSIKMLEIDKALKYNLQLDVNSNKLEMQQLQDIFLDNIDNEKHRIKLEKLQTELYDYFSKEDYCNTIIMGEKLIAATKYSNYNKCQYLWYANYMSGVSYLKLKNYNKAELCAKESLAYINPQNLDQNYSLSLWILARIQEENENAKGAIKVYNALVKYYKNTNNTIMRIACVFNISKILKRIKLMRKIQIILINTKPNYKNYCNTEEYKQQVLNDMSKEINAF